MKMEVMNDYEYKGQIIELQSGDKVTIGEKSDPNGPYPGWVHCTAERTGKTGWVAEGILMVNGNTASVTQEYTSEEMTVFKGDTVDTIYELNGWYWCRRVSDGKEAWVDKGNLKSL